MTRNRTAIAPPGMIQIGVTSAGAEELSQPSGKSSVIATASSPNALTAGLAEADRLRFLSAQDVLLRTEQ